MASNEPVALENIVTEGKFVEYKMKEIEKSKRIEDDVIKIKNDIDEIKDLLKKLILSK